MSALNGAPAAGEKREAMDEADIDLTIVVPVLNEVESLRDLDAELRQAVSPIGIVAEIIYVDDGSTDGSRALLDTLRHDAAEGIRTRIVHLRRNYGQSMALGVGFRLAAGRVVVPLDADGQNNPADIPQLVERLDQGYDVVSGWRRQRQDKAVSRRFPSWAANQLISWLSGVDLHDHGCTLKAYRSRLLRHLHLHGEMHRFIPVFLAPLGARVTELEVDHRARKHGTSHYGTERIFKVGLDLATIRFVSRYAARPMHFFGQAAVLFVLAACFAVAAMVVFKYGWLRLIGIDYQASFIQTPFPALAATFSIGAVMALFFGILGEMLVRMQHDLRDPSIDAVDRVLDSHADGDGT